MQSRKQSAGGLPALLSSEQFLRKSGKFLENSQALLSMNQTKGFDCPGCAWPEPAKRSAFEFCENGVKVLTDISTSKKADALFFNKHAVSALRTQSDKALNDHGRLVEPLSYNSKSDCYEAVAWSRAFEIIGAELNKIDADQAVFYTSGRASNEAAFLYQLFVRMYGTNNLPDCSNLCHESSGVGLTESIGIGKGTVKLEDFEKADCILVIGQNPGTNHPRMLTELQKAARRGCDIVSINPLKELGLDRFAHPQEPMGLLGRSTQISSFHLPVRIGGDIAVLKGLAKSLLKTSLNTRFITENTHDFEAYRQNIEDTSWAEIETQSGLSQNQITKVGDMLARKKRVIACWAMGITQHVHGVANVQEIVNLLLLGGHIGREGAGLCPVRGHSNVQGDRTMGIWEKPKPGFLDALEKHFDFKAPREHGLDAVESIKALHQGTAKAFVALGGNFLSACPDTELLANAFLKTNLTVHITTKLNRSHLYPGRVSLILPCLSRAEADQRVSVENSMGFVSASQGRLKPASRNLKSEVAIINQIAHRTLGLSLRYQKDYVRIRSAIEACVPGFKDFETKLDQGGFYLPNGPREGVFPTPNKKACFITHPIPDMTLPGGLFWMMTIRSHDQFNTAIYSDDDRYRGIKGNRKVVFINTLDITDLGLNINEKVNLLSGDRSVKNYTLVPYDIPRGCVATYFPETNLLFPLNLQAKKSGTPAFKSIKIRFQQV